MKYPDLFTTYFRAFTKKESGFTLIELLVVMVIISFLSIAMINNFSRTKIDIDQTANLIMATIRQAQTKTVSSNLYNNYNPCGYGVHYVDPTSIVVYVGPDASTATPNCTDMNKNYNPNRDSVLLTQTIKDSQVQLQNSFSDIFFLPPDPKTYLNNDASLNQAPISIQVGPIGRACTGNCRTIYVYSSGKIESQ
ncbi:MAG: type II secretion system protein [Candidatus Pacebacteria bacterium]|nr:type II secretion system protein [Candidatus Paceibacterota bacterium]